jgi:Kayvirus endonuclease
MEKYKCCRCKSELSKECFYKNNTKARGINSFCKDCERKHNQEKRIKYNDSYKEKDKRYYKKNKDNIKEKRALYYEKNRVKTLAHQAVRKALVNGDLVKPPFCENYPFSDVCNDGLVAHHEDYSKPLEVKWLCPTCHMRLHHEKK